VKKLSPRLLPEAKSFSLDFHPIPYRGEEAVLENHYLPCRGKAGPSIQNFFAQEHEQRVFCYTNASLTRDEQSQEVVRFVDYWRALMGRNPEWLYFDSKLTTYEELSEPNRREGFFVTIRRRGAGILQRLARVAESHWQSATIDIPKRRQQRIRYFDELGHLRDNSPLASQSGATLVLPEPAAAPRLSHPFAFLRNGSSRPTVHLRLSKSNHNPFSHVPTRKPMPATTADDM
jgi:hypothetical protein